MIKARAYRQKERAEWVKIAQQTVWILNAFRGKRGRRLRVEDLIGSEQPETQAPRKKTTPEETKELINELMTRFGHE
jgi:hypothetical protein